MDYKQLWPESISLQNSTDEARVSHVLSHVVWWKYPYTVRYILLLGIYKLSLQ